MFVIASFNGGPSEHTAYLAIVMSCISGAIVGGIVRRLWIGILAGVLSGALVCGCILLGGNRPGDAAGLFLVASLIILCPLGAGLGAVGAVSSWIARKYLKPDHEPTREGASSTMDTERYTSRDP